MKNISLKLANKEDTNFLLKMYNLGVKENNFKNKNKISLQEHIHWYKKALKSNSVYIYICKKKKNKIGYVKFNIFHINSCYVSIIIKKLYRKNDIGSFCLKKALKKCFKSINLKNIYAEVLKNNKVSQKFFEKNNFKKIKITKKLSEVFDKKNYLYLKNNENKIYK